MTANLPDQTDVTVRGGGSQSPDAAPPASSSDGSSVQLPVLSIRLRQAPAKDCASFRNRTPPRRGRSPCRSESGSRVATTRTRAMSSVQ